MAYTTIFKATELFGTDDAIEQKGDKDQQTGIYTLTKTDGITLPKDNTTIQSINFNLDHLRYQRREYPVAGAGFYLTNTTAIEESTIINGKTKYMMVIPYGGVSYLNATSKYTITDSETGGSVTDRTNTTCVGYQLSTYPKAYCVDPFAPSAENYTVRYRTISATNSNPSKEVTDAFCGTDQLSVNLVSAQTSGDGKWRIKTPAEKTSYATQKNYGTWTCTVVWDYTNTNCTAPTSVLVGGQQSLTTGKGKEVTLSWSGATPGRKGGVDEANTIKEYYIYRNKKYLTKTSETSITVKSPTEKTGDTYTYTIKSIGTATGYDSDISTAQATLTAEWTDPEISSFTCTTKEGEEIKSTGLTGTVYVGNLGASLTFNWEAENGDNNDIAKITLTSPSSDPDSNNEEDVTNITQKTYSSGTFSEGNYILTITDSNESTFTKTITIKIIEGEASFNNVIDTYPQTSTLTSSSVSVTLKSLTASTYNSNSIKYNLLTDLSDDGFYKTPVFRTDWKTSIDLLENNFLKRGETFKLIIRAYYYADHGGYTIKDYPITDPISYKIVGPHSAASIIYLKDNYSTQELANTNIFNYGYGEITIKAIPAKEDTSVASGDEFSYVLKIQHDKETSSLEDVLQLTKTEADEDQLIGSFSLQNFTEGTELTITIESKDENLLTATSNAVSLTKIKLPTIDSCNLSIDASLNSNKQKGNAFGFEAEVTPYVAATKIGYKATIYAPDDETNKDILSETSAYTSGDTKRITTSEATVIYCDPTEENSLEEQLYNTVITNQNPLPQGRFVFSVWYEGYEYYQKTIEKDFNYDYTTELAGISSADYSIGYPDRNYLNPFEEIPIYLKNNGWTDAVGGTSGGIVEMTLSQSSTKIKLEDLNTTDSAYPIYTKVANYKYSNYNARDSVISLILEYTLTYSGNSSVKKTIQTPVEINLAKWTPGTAMIKNANYSTHKTTITDSEGTQIEKEILVLEGNFSLPLGWCGSTDYENIKSLEYILIDANETVLGSGSIENDLDNSSIEQKFSISLPDEQTKTERQIKALLIFTNTSDGTIPLETDLFSLFISDVSIAIRKNKIGINVAKDYGDSEEGLKNYSILKINGLADLDNTIPIIHVSSPNTPSSDVPISLMQLSTQDFESVFSTNGELLQISKLTYSVPIVLTSEENEQVEYLAEESCYQIKNEAITENNTIEIIPSPTISVEQWKAYNKMQLLGIMQEVGKIKVKIMGKVPVIDIPITLVIRGF